VQLPGKRFENQRRFFPLYGGNVQPFGGRVRQVDAGHIGSFAPDPDFCLNQLVRVALYQPDIPPNTGAILRLCACLGVPVDIIEPCGFPFSDRQFRRAGMDYLAGVEIVRHASWEKFVAMPRSGRLVLLSTRAALAYTDFAFRRDDSLLFGRETAGVPDAVHESADACLKVPLRPGMRSLNVATAAAMVLGEALRQTAAFPAPSVGTEP